MWYVTFAKKKKRKGKAWKKEKKLEEKDLKETQCCIFRNNFLLFFVCKAYFLFPLTNRTSGQNITWNWRLFLLHKKPKNSLNWGREKHVNVFFSLLAWHSFVGHVDARVSIFYHIRTEKTSLDKMCPLDDHQLLHREQTWGFALTDTLHCSCA